MAENQGQHRFATGGGPGAAAGGVTEKARDMVTGAVETVRDTAKGWASNVGDAAQGVGRGAEHAYSASRDAVVGAEQSMEDFIRRHPVPVVLGALMVGCLVGCAMGRLD
jgi:hypothetical protein